MSKRWTVIASIAALAAALLLVSCKASSPTPSTVGTTPTTTQGSVPSATGTAPAVPQGQEATSTNGGASNPGAGGTTGSAALPPLKPFPKMPESKLAARKATSPEAKGKTLAPLSSAPKNTISALKLGDVPDGAQYQIEMRPIGYGPADLFGSRLVIRVDEATPVGTAPAVARIVKANLLVLVNTEGAGTVTKGGSYTATLMFRTDGSKMRPVLSRVVVR